MADKAKIVIVAALSKNNRSLGYKNKLLWHIPDDLKRFKEKTLGHPIIMGRKTFESIIAILGKPLPGRKNIVITRNPDFSYTGVTAVTSLEAALVEAKKNNPTEIHIGGGAEIYAQALPLVDILHLTLVDDEPPSDTFFPAYSEFTEEVEREERTYNGLSYTWLTLTRP